MTIGRPSLYQPEFAATARDACARGADNDGLAALFGVSTRTVDRWVGDIAEFRDAVEAGRALADTRVTSALFSRAVGLEQTLTRVFLHKGEPVTVRYAVDLPPDVRACIHWLRNRRPRDWRENRPIEPDITFEELEAASERARRPYPDATPAADSWNAIPPSERP